MQPKTFSFKYYINSLFKIPLFLAAPRESVKWDLSWGDPCQCHWSWSCSSHPEQTQPWMCSCNWTLFLFLVREHISLSWGLDRPAGRTFDCHARYPTEYTEIILPRHYQSSLKLGLTNKVEMPLNPANLELHIKAFCRKRGTQWSQCLIQLKSWKVFFKHKSNAWLLWELGILNFLSAQSIAKAKDTVGMMLLQSQ